MLFLGKSLEEVFDTKTFRKDMYKTLVGFCLKDKQKGFENSYNTCLVSIFTKISL